MILAIGHDRRSLSLPCMTDRGASSLAYCCLLNLGRALKGIMGSAMAANLQKAGMATTVWNRSGNKCAPLVAMGTMVLGMSGNGPAKLPCWLVRML